MSHLEELKKRNEKFREGLVLGIILGMGIGILLRDIFG